MAGLSVFKRPWAVFPDQERFCFEILETDRSQLNKRFISKSQLAVRGSVVQWLRVSNYNRGELNSKFTLGHKT